MSTQGVHTHTVWSPATCHGNLSQCCNGLYWQHTFCSDLLGTRSVGWSFVLKIRQEMLANMAI